MVAENQPIADTGAEFTAKDLRDAEAREAYILGDSPRLQPLEINEVSSGLLEILRLLTTVNATLDAKGEMDRGGTVELHRQLLADPEGAAASPEIMADLVRLPEIVRTLIRHPELFAVHTDVGLHLHTSGALTPRDREFAVLRVAWLCKAPYEWGEHVMVAKRFGFTSEDIQRIIDGPDAEGLSRHESAILRAVDELRSDAMISDATWEVLSEGLDERQLIELPIIIGHYQSTAYYQNSLRLRLHSGNLGLKAR